MAKIVKAGIIQVANKLGTEASCEQHRQAMIEALLLGQGTIAHSILPEGSWAYTPGTTYQYDPAKARQLLDEAGFKVLGN